MRFIKSVFPNFNGTNFAKTISKQQLMKTKLFIALICVPVFLFLSDSIFAQNIKFYKSNPAVPVRSIDFDKDSILHIAIKADTILSGFDMMFFSSTLSRKNGKHKWQKVNNLMGETFYGKLRDDGYYHFTAFRMLGGGLSYSEIGLSEDDLRFGKTQMNISLYGKKRLNPINLKDSGVSSDVNLITATNGMIQYEADIIDFSLPITIERYSASANIRVKKNIVLTTVSIGVLGVILSPLLILLPLL